jgi:hypothetical protein
LWGTITIMTTTTQSILPLNHYAGFPQFLAAVYFWDWHTLLRKRGVQVPWFREALGALIPVREDTYLLGIDYFREVSSSLTQEEQQDFVDGLQVVVQQLP